MATDYAEALVVWLQTHDDAESIRDLIVNGATGIVESGDLTASLLSSAEATRRTTPTAQALALAVQDAGEDPVPRHKGQFQQFIVLRIYDRGRGYSNIRAVRKAIKDTLGNMPRAITGEGVFIPRYRGRSGHRWDPAFNISFEAITLRVDVAQIISD